ncbi:MAG: C1 family peptidase [Beijerinckiaceae bacterium]
MTSVTIKTDLRHLFGSVRDQGQRPTCLAFAASDAHAALRGGWTPLSCEYAFFHAQRRSGRQPTDGALLPAMLGALREDGQPAEASWPYLSALPAEPSHWKPPAGVTPLFRRAGEPGAYAIDAIIAHLDRGVPVLTLMRLSRSFYFAGPDGLIDQVPGETPDFHRRHAVIAVAHGLVGTERTVLIRNSWGEHWGAKGYGWLTEKFMQQRVYELAILKEDLSVSAHSAAA